MFNLMYEMGWRSEPFDLDDWVANYTTRRYGCTMERPCNTAIGAWHLLQVAQPLTHPPHHHPHHHQQCHNSTTR